MTYAALFYTGLAMIAWPVLVGIFIRIPILLSIHLPLDSKQQTEWVTDYCQRLSTGRRFGVVMPLRRRIRRAIQFAGAIIMTWLAYQSIN